MATINHEYLQNMNSSDTKNVNFVIFKESGDTIDKKPESGETDKEKKPNGERSEPIEQEEKNIPAHFYHKPGPRELARGNDNKTKRYSHLNV